MAYPKAIAHKGAVGRGATLPQLFSVQGLGDCLVKFPQSDHGPKALVNELVAFQIADVLGLEHPPCGVVEIPSTILPKNGRLEVVSPHGDVFVFLADLAFYSQWLPSAEHPNIDDILTLELANPQMLAGVVTLDLLVENWDRTPVNPNFLLQRHEQSRLSLIDMGLAFGGGMWELGNLLEPKLWSIERPLPYGEDLSDLFKTLRAPGDFWPYLATLDGLSRERLEGIVANIPPQWGITPRESAALVDYIYAKAQALPDYLEQRLKKQEWWL